MSITPESSFDSMIRLGRKTNLLDRNRLANGNTLFGKIQSFIESSKKAGGLFTILGHPSAGKTTEFNRIARELCSNEKFRNQFLPLYTELQNAESLDVNFNQNFIWESIVSGSIDIELHGSEPSRSLDSYCNYCKQLDRIPILMIDTLDILMLHQVNQKDVQVAKLWADFLQSVINNKVILIWTCRPFEWRFFKKEIDSRYDASIEVVELPTLLKEQLDPFTDIEKLVESDSSENIKLANMLNKSDWPYQEAWNKWTINFQAHMPIFADRWSSSTKKSKKLDNYLFFKFAKDFANFTSAKLAKKHWFEFVKKLPSEYLYSWLWDRVTKRMNQSYNLTKQNVNSMRNVLEEEAKDTALNLSSNSSRVRLEYEKLVKLMIEKCDLDEVSVSQLFVVCESRGMLVRNGIWVDFTHQLLFEEAVLKSSDDDDIDKLQKFPSILLRTRTDVRSFTKADEILRDEVLSAVGNWSGYLLSYHPSCISKNSNLDTTWEKWIQYSQENISLNVPDLEINEHTEKRIALNKYQESDGKKSLIVNGAPGTGKTYFCKDYLKWALSNSSNKKMKWRYYTMNGHLANHFDLLVEEFANIDPEMKSDLDNSTGGSFAIGKLLRYINPEIKLDKKWNEKYGLGLLTFAVFKNLLRDYFEQKSVRFSGAKCPPLADAWQLYNEIIHDPITGERREKLDKTSFKELNTHSYRMNSKTIDWFLKFHNEKLVENWWTYAYASSDCRAKLESLTPLRHEQYEVDILIVDEVQDISPPVMALLLELMRPGFASHSIMIAGDMIQTVNRSGFHWIDFSQKTARSLQNSNHPDKWRLIDFGVIDKHELNIHRTTLKYVWRNGKKLVEFNNKMRKNFASGFGIEELYSSNYDYPGGELLISQASLDKDEDSKITVIEANSVDEYNKLIESLAKSTTKLIGEDVAILAPFEIEQKWNEDFMVPVYDAESVKGLEFDSIVVLMPYLLPDDEARSSLIRQLGESNEEIQNQIQKWCDSWKLQKGDASQLNFENFNQLFLNIMTRMNVLFSRPEKRILIINPVKFGQRVQVFDRSNDDDKMMSFGMPKLPKDVGISRTESMFDTLSVPIKNDKYQINLNSYVKLLPKALNQASLNDDGTQVDNERKVWDNLWFNIKDSKDAPLKAISYAGGISTDSNVNIFELLRSDLGRPFRLKESSLSDPENQFIYALSKGSIQEDSLLLPPEIAHYIFSNLEDIIRKIMHGTEDHRRLHEFMMQRLFGVDVTQIKNYDFDYFIKNNISPSSLSLKKFSLAFTWHDDHCIRISNRTSEYRELIVYHMFSRVQSGLNQPIERRPEWVDESETLWNAINEFVEDGNFDTDLVNDEELRSLILWISDSFAYGITSHGQVASNISSWKDIVSSGKSSPLHKTAWGILNKVIPNLHADRVEFDGFKDRLYIHVYDALRLNLDLNGIRILHEMLEYFILQARKSGKSIEELFDYTLRNIPYLFETMEKSAKVFVDNISNLGRHWLSRTIDRQTHKFKSSRGASVIGAMIHASYLDQSRLKDIQINQSSIIREFERQLDRYFDSTISLHKNSTDYWLKYNLQDEIFRMLLAKLLDLDKATLTIQLEKPPEFLSKLLMLDYIAMTDPNWASSRSVSTKQMIPDFSTVKIDSLTEQIVTTFTSTNARSARFFRTYIDNLSKFLDIDFVDRKRKSSDYRSIEKLVQKSPGEWINREIWVTWEWFLHLCSKYPKLDSIWTSTQKDRLLTEGQSKRFDLHKYLRINHFEKSSTIYEEIYRSQYTVIQKFANDDLSSFSRDMKVKLGHNLLDFTEFSARNKRPKSFKFNQWKSLQRLIFSNAHEKEGTHQKFVDWEICYHLWRLLNSRGIKLDNERFVDTLEDIYDVMQSGLLKYIDRRISAIEEAISQGDDVAESYFTFMDLLEYSEADECSEVIEILESILSANSSYSKVIGNLKGLKLARIENSIFGNKPEITDVRKQLVGELIQYLMSELNSIQKESGGLIFSRTEYFSDDLAKLNNQTITEINRLYRLE